MSRRSSLDAGSVTAGLINEAYNEVKKVADSIDEVIKVADNLSSLSSFDVTVIVGIGDGTLSGDMAATDWTGNAHADPTIQTALRVEVTENLNIYYGGPVYYYKGVTPVLLGIGGTATIASDYGLLGNGDHRALSNLDDVDQHAIAAITGLTADLTAKQVLIDASFKFPVGDNTDATIADIATRRTNFLGFDTNGDFIYSSGTGATTAAAVSTVDSGDYFTGVEVESNLQEVGNSLALINAQDVKSVAGTQGSATSDRISNMVSLTQLEYDAIASPDLTTLYVIKG